MAIITSNVSKLSIAEKIVRGQDIITKSTGNPNVPGNAAALASFSTAQAAMLAAMNDEVAARSALPAKVTARKNALINWNAALNALAGFTESATNGNAQRIETTGFEVKAPRTPPKRLPAPAWVSARTNGTPGHTKLDWEPLTGAKSYTVQASVDPITATSWKFSTNCTAASADVNGAEPGERMWYRVAGVNAKGQGPWSEPVCRPVM